MRGPAGRIIWPKGPIERPPQLSYPLLVLKGIAIVISFALQLPSVAPAVLREGVEASISRQALSAGPLSARKPFLKAIPSWVRIYGFWKRPAGLAANGGNPNASLFNTFRVHRFRAQVFQFLDRAFDAYPNSPGIAARAVRIRAQLELYSDLDWKILAMDPHVPLMAERAAEDLLPLIAWRAEARLKQLERDLTRTEIITRILKPVSILDLHFLTSPPPSSLLAESVWMGWRGLNSALARDLSASGQSTRAVAEIMRYRDQVLPARHRAQDFIALLEKWDHWSESSEPSVQLPRDIWDDTHHRPEFVGWRFMALKQRPLYLWYAFGFAWELPAVVGIHFRVHDDFGSEIRLLLLRSDPIGSPFRGLTTFLHEIAHSRQHRSFMALYRSELGRVLIEGTQIFAEIGVLQGLWSSSPLNSFMDKILSRRGLQSPGNAEINQQQLAVSVYLTHPSLSYPNERHFVKLLLEFLGLKYDPRQELPAFLVEFRNGNPRPLRELLGADRYDALQTFLELLLRISRDRQLMFSSQFILHFAGKLFFDRPKEQPFPGSWKNRIKAIVDSIVLWLTEKSESRGQVIGFDLDQLADAGRAVLLGQVSPHRYRRNAIEKARAAFDTAAPAKGPVVTISEGGDGSVASIQDKSNIPSFVQDIFRPETGPEVRQMFLTIRKIALTKVRGPGEKYEMRFAIAVQHHFHLRTHWRTTLPKIFFDLGLTPNRERKFFVNSFYPSFVQWIEIGAPLDGLDWDEVRIPSALLRLWMGPRPGTRRAIKAYLEAALSLARQGKRITKHALQAERNLADHAMPYYIHFGHVVSHLGKYARAILEWKPKSRSIRQRERNHYDFGSLLLLSALIGHYSTSLSALFFSFGIRMVWRMEHPARSRFLRAA